MTQPLRAWRDRAPKAVGGFKCCWVCGEPGGNPFSPALRRVGYRVPHSTIAYAHDVCLYRAQREHNEHLEAQK